MLLFSLQLSSGTFATSVCSHVKSTDYLLTTGFQILSLFSFFSLEGLLMISK